MSTLKKTQQSSQKREAWGESEKTPVRPLAGSLSGSRR